MEKKEITCYSTNWCRTPSTALRASCCICVMVRELHCPEELEKSLLTTATSAKLPALWVTFAPLTQRSLPGWRHQSLPACSRLINSFVHQAVRKLNSPWLPALQSSGLRNPLRSTNQKHAIKKSINETKRLTITCCYRVIYCCNSHIVYSL